MAEALNIPIFWHNSLTDKVSMFIHNQQWKVTHHLLVHFPIIASFTGQVMLSVEDIYDFLVQTTNAFGDMTLKNVFSFKARVYPQLLWTKFVWSKYIPPSESFIALRLIHNKLP